ncbi:hypothetical protein [Pseudomonas sp. Y24-6]|uniref:hypothetical protein n=1 Tax=Pseudomonas sp. Y24-6 TaxID=2750013 RepID=UPI001CE05372|nr:hypothetical protein [Pseudomonas sp. Y24-6]MCA4960845.1 hypothetical protein [Pseudomonas sp. Y24-6]
MRTVEELIITAKPHVFFLFFDRFVERFGECSQLAAPFPCLPQARHSSGSSIVVPALFRGQARLPDEWKRQQSPLPEGFLRVLSAFANQWHRHTTTWQPQQFSALPGKAELNCKNLRLHPRFA